MYFTFLNTQTGRGLFLLFLAMMTLETPGAGFAVIGTFAILAAILNIVIGHKELQQVKIRYPFDDG